MTRIYQSPSMGDAQVRVAFVQNIGQADLLVHRVSSWGLARGGALWYITRHKQDAEVYIYPCSLGMAQLRVCFVGSYGQAGWINTDHPLANKFFRAARRWLRDGAEAAGHGSAQPGGLAGGGKVMGARY